MGEWKEVELSAIADVQTGPFGSQLHASDYVPVGVPVIMPNNIGQR
jgi:type I restriction enzyme S subunit